MQMGYLVTFARSRICRGELKVHTACCMVSWKVVQILYQRNKIIINEYLKLHLRLLFVMSEVSKALYTYMNRMKPLPQYVHTDTAVASSLIIRSRSYCNSNFKSNRVLIQRNNSKF